MKICPVEIARKWHPYTVRMFFVMILANIAFVAVIVIKCETSSYVYSFIKVSLFLVSTSGFLVGPFSVISRKGYNAFKIPDSSDQKKLANFFIYIIVLLFCIFTIFVPLLSVVAFIAYVNSCS